jgi:hypothetical protein
LAERAIDVAHPIAAAGMGGELVNPLVGKWRDIAGAHQDREYTSMEIGQEANVSEISEQDLDKVAGGAADSTATFHFVKLPMDTVTLKPINVPDPPLKIDPK